MNTETKLGRTKQWSATYLRLQNLPRNQHGNSLVAYALLLGGIAVALVGGLVDFSNGISTALTNEADNIATIAGTATSSGSPTTSPNSPTPSSPTANNPSNPTPSSPTANNPAPSSPTSGNGNNGNNGNGNNGNGNNGGKGKGKGKNK